MSEEKFEYVDKLSVDLTIAKASIELGQRVDVLLKILEQERAVGYREGHMNAIYQRKWVKLNRTRDRGSCTVWGGRTTWTLPGLQNSPWRKRMDTDLIICIVLGIIVGALVAWDMYKDKEK